MSLMDDIQADAEAVPPSDEFPGSRPSNPNRAQSVAMSEDTYTCVFIFGESLFVSDEEEFSLRGVKS